MSEKKEIGLAVVGCGTIGRIRAIMARDYPGIGWIGLCDINKELGYKLQKDCDADFFTENYAELLKRPEVNAVIVATDENHHFGPIMDSLEKNSSLFIEKPLATDLTESREVLDKIRSSNVDAVLGYTQRFRRRFLAVKQKLLDDKIGNVTSVVTRAFMNSMVPIATVRRTNERKNLTPMVVSGTHSMDMSLWLMAGKYPRSIFAQSVDKKLRSHGTKDSTFGIFTMDDDAIFSMNISWALPTVWPGSVYGLEIGIVGTEGVIDIEDTHRDLVLASEKPQGHGYNPSGYNPADNRHVDFLTSYPPGDVYNNQLWGPMREETNSWFQRLYVGTDTPHASAEDGHKNLVMTMAMDASSKINEKIVIDDNIEDEIVKIQNS